MFLWASGTDIKTWWNYTNGLNALTRMVFKKKTKLIRICQLENVTNWGKEIKVLQRKKCRENNIQYFLKYRKRKQMKLQVREVKMYRRKC